MSYDSDSSFDKKEQTPTPLGGGNLFDVFPTKMWEKSGETDNMHLNDRVR